MNTPCKVNRSPNWFCGVASRRSRCRRPGLRTTMSTSVSASGGCWRRSSVHCKVPDWMTNSVCEKNQSATGLGASGSAVFPSTSRPATRIFPSAVRRTSSMGRSMCSCSSSNCSSERNDTATTTRPSTSASRPCASSKLTWLSAKEGTNPCVCAVTWPMRTGTPTVRVASASSSPRQSPIRGTMKK